MPLRKPSEFNLIDSHRGAEDVASGPYPESLHTHTRATHTHGKHTHTHGHTGNAHAHGKHTHMGTRMQANTTQYLKSCMSSFVLNARSGKSGVKRDVLARLEKLCEVFHSKKVFQKTLRKSNIVTFIITIFF